MQPAAFSNRISRSGRCVTRGGSHPAPMTRPSNCNIIFAALMHRRLELGNPHFRFGDAKCIFQPDSASILSHLLDAMLQHEGPKDSVALSLGQRTRVVVSCMLSKLPSSLSCYIRRRQCRCAVNVLAGFRASIFVREATSCGIVLSLYGLFA